MLRLAGASQRRRRVALRSQAFGGTRSERELSTFGLVVHEARWYVAAYDHRRRALRTFRADRITRPSLLDAAAKAPPEGFDGVAHVERSLAEVPWRWDVVADLDLSAAEARRRVAATLATVTPVGDRTRLELRAESLDWVASLLAGIGCPFTVLRPRDELGEALERVADRLRAAST